MSSAAKRSEGGEMLVQLTASDLKRIVAEAVTSALAANGNAIAEEQEAYLTTAEVAAMLKCTTRNIPHLIKAGLPSIRVGREYRFQRAHVKSWAEGRKR